MTTAQRLDAIRANQEALIALNNVGGKKFLQSIFCPDDVFVSLSSDRDMQEAKEILDWFLDGGHIETHTTVKTPYGERKNSRKKNTTKFFVFVKGCMRSQIGHITTQNYHDDFWSHAMKRLIAAPADKFCYQNGSFIACAMERNPQIVDLGEKK